MTDHLKNFLSYSQLEHPDGSQFIRAIEAMAERVKMLDAGLVPTASAISLVGNPRNGKTELLKKIPELIPEFRSSVDRERPLVQFKLTGADSAKNLAVNIAEAVDIILKGRQSENDIRPKIRRRFKTLGVRVVIIDEAHHALTGEISDVEILNRLKSEYIDYEPNPIFIVLAGLPDLEDSIKAEPQYAGRNIPTRIRDLTLIEASAACKHLIAEGAKRANLKIAADIEQQMIPAKLASTALKAFGMMIDLIDDALRNSLKRGSDTLTADDLILAARTYTGSHGDDIFANDAWTMEAMY